ncbi:MAG TPA: DUF624 domain-containing protein [Chloroflexota bacterium]|jgi:uncharacterized membrane protein YesL|nr:DUF624 domain-containing protein [Chloroflexota bacterium]
MLQALRYLRAAFGEFYFDLPRMFLLNIFWFLTALPFIGVLFVLTLAIRGETPAPWPVIAVQGVVLGALALALAGPGTAAIYYVTNRLANGELLETRRFWSAFKHFFWRGWLLGLANAGTGALLVLNIWFYWTLDRPGSWILGIIFTYLLVMWMAIQSYLYSLLVEMDQAVRLVIRNALFMALDNLGLTLGLMLVNVLVLGISLVPGAFLLAFATMSLLSIVNNKAVVEAINRYREAGRIITGS